MNEERYVFDTNVLVSALLFADSGPGRLFFLCLERGTVLLSRAMIEELNDVLHREKFDRYITQEERERFLAALILRAELVEIEELIEACRDPDDDRILETAVDGRATAIVSRDKDLLVLHPFRGTPIVPPEELLSELSDESTAG